MKRACCLMVVLVLAGCSGGDPEPKVGDNPAAANGRRAEDVSTPAQKARREAAAPKGNPW